MSDYELKRIIHKKLQFKKLLLARAYVRQLESELRGEPAKPEEPRFVPQFLRTQLGNGLTQTSRSTVPLSLHETAAAAASLVHSWRPGRPTRRVPEMRRPHLIEGTVARNRERVEVQPEPYL